MFHLLNALTDTGAFAMRRPVEPGTRRGATQARSGRLTARRQWEGSASASTNASGPRQASRWYKPVLCCGSFSIALVIGAATAGRAHAQSGAPQSSRAEKIANALTAAPEEVTRNATVKDWPTKEGDGLVLLRQGTNGWVCLPDDTVTPGNDPMCMDETFHGALAAFIAGQPPKVTRVGYAYMLTSDAEGSNIDPMAKGPTPTNQWHHAGPHVMVLYPDAKLLDGLPTKPSASGPYVMFPGTPIAHVMFPVQSGYATAGSSHNASTRKTGKRP